MIFGKQASTGTIGDLEMVTKELESSRRNCELQKAAYQAVIAKMESDHAIKINELVEDHKLVIKHKDFEIAHNADELVVKLTGELNETKKSLAVSESENKMLHEMVDQDASVIEVKELVTNLINKLPNVNIGGELGFVSRQKEDGSK